MSLIGCVKFFNAKKGFGFVTVLTQDHERSNTDLFVHFSNLNVRDDEYKRLFPGEYVSFNYGKGQGRDGRDICIDVTGVLGGRLLTENVEFRYRYFPKESRQQGSGHQGQEAVTEEVTATEQEAPAEEEDENDPEA